MCVIAKTIFKNIITLRIMLNVQPKSSTKFYIKLIKQIIYKKNIEKIKATFSKILYLPTLDFTSKILEIITGKDLQH